MRIDLATSAEADRLNALWDRRLDGPVLPATQKDAESLALIARLEALVPSPPASDVEIARFQDRIERMTFGKDVQMANPAGRQISPSNRIATRRPFGRRTGPLPPLRTIDRFATFALIVAIASALVLAAALRDDFGGRIPSQFAALGDREDQPPADDIGGGGLMSIEVRPHEHESGKVGVGLWTATLPGNTAMMALPPFAGGTAPDIGFLVTTGSVLFTLNGDETTVAEGESVGSLPGPEYVRNISSAPAQLLVLAPTQVNGPFPLTIGPWPPADPSAQTNVESGSTPTPPPILVSSVILDDTTAHQYRVEVSQATLAPDMPIDVSRFGSPGATLRSITLKEGPLTLWSPDAEDGPPPRSIQPGETVALGANSVWATDLRVPGPENTQVMGLLTMPAADNPTLNQNLESVAPFWGKWTVPESGETHLEVRRLIVQPGGSYSLPTEAGVVYHIASGQVVILNETTGNGAPVDAGGTIAQNPGVVLTFRNGGAEPVELVQTVVSKVDADDLYRAYAEETLDRVSVEWLVRETKSLAPGDVTSMLQVHEYNGENDGGAFGDGEPGLVLITSTSGEIEVSRLGGIATVIPARGEEPIDAPLGEGIPIEPGGYLIAEPGAGWSVTGGTNGPSTGIVFSVSPDQEPEATPLATPATVGSETSSLVGDPDNCDIAPLTSDMVADIVSTPSPSTNLLDRSLRGVTGGVSDPATTDGLVALLQSYTDCQATGDYTKIYAFYSDQAVRESDTIQDMVAADHIVGSLPRVTTTVEEIEIFPDGRAGARTVIDGQPAYLTFMMEGGQWTIDVWDDSGSGLLPGGTPEA